MNKLYVSILLFLFITLILLIILLHYKKLNKKLLKDLFLKKQQNKILFLKYKKYNIIYYDFLQIIYIRKFYLIISKYLNKQIKNKQNINDLKLQIIDLSNQKEIFYNQLKEKDRIFKDLEYNKNNEILKIKEDKNYFENLYIVEQSSNQEKNKNEDLFSINNKKDTLFLLDNFNIIIAKMENNNNKIKTLLNYNNPNYL